MLTYSDKEIWEEVVMVIDGMKYHGDFVDDREYQEAIVGSVRNWMKEGQDLGNAIDSALFEYWATNSGEYSV